MTELLRDPCESFAWFTPSSSPTIVAARNGNGFQTANSIQNLELIIPVDKRSDWTMVGFAFRSITLVANTKVVQYQADTTAGTGNPDQTLLLQTNGQLQFCRGASTVLGSSATGVIAANTWYYVEVYCRTDETAGVAIVRVNGTEVINLTGQDTKNASAPGTPAVQSRVRFASGVTVTTQWDDFYLKTGAGETFNGSIVVTAPSDARDARHALYVATQGAAADTAIVRDARHALYVAQQYTTTEVHGQRSAVRVVEARLATIESARQALRVLRPWTGTAEPNPTTLIVQEDFDSFTDWTSVLGVVGAGTGRTGAGMKVVTNNAIYYVVAPVLESDTMTVGFAFKPNTTSGNGLLGAFRSDNTATSPVVLLVTTAGALQFRLGTTGGTVILTTANGVVANGTWCYVEIQSRVHDTLGFVTVRVNGTQVGTVTGIDTRTVGTKSVYDSWGFSGASGSTHVVDDFYLITGPDAVFRGSERYGVDNNVIHEPFDNLAAWSITGGTPTITASGRTANALDLSNASENVTLAIPLGQRSYQVVIGFAVYVTAPLAVVDLVKLYDASAGLLGLLRLSASGQLSFAGSQGPTAAGVITADTWYYVEWQTMALGVGASQSIIRVNNAQAGFVENFNPGITAGDVASVVLNGGSANPTYYDDLYVRTGGLSDFEGDQRIGPSAGTTATKAWNGAAFATAPVKAWSGSAFVAAAVKSWNGSAFV